MATSGSFTGSTANNYITPKIVWSATQSTSANTSTITAKLYYSKSTSATIATSGTWGGTITIGSSTKSFSGVSLTLSPGGGDVLVATYSLTVKHSDDGALSLTISATGAVANTTLSSTTISSKVTLDTINRGLVYIGNGSEFVAYQVYIGNGSSWEQYIPYIGDGTSWKLYT